ncbi:MAG: hypothetical protein K2X82_26380 [Gemmataceae bacterium]|nr:hypothetical protein [Gemmataceae bacterium]
MTRFLVAAAVAVGVGAGAARAGGPPPVYVVVDRVEATADAVTIHGAFVRLKAGPRYEYGRPVEGFVTLALDEAKADACRAEWKKWRQAAGTGRAVAVGMCGAGGALLKVAIHKPGDKPGAADATYTPGHLGAVDKQDWDDEAPVRELLAFVKEAKEARSARREAGR